MFLTFLGASMCSLETDAQQCQDPTMNYDVR